MAANYTPDQITKATTEAADDFVHSFYHALQSNRRTLSTYYVQPPTTLLFNGNPVPDGAAVQEIFDNQMPQAHYEVQSYDCQMINPNYPTTAVPGAPPVPQPPTAPGKGGPANFSLLLVVSGFVRYGASRDLPNRGFSETFVLVPNPAVAAAGAQAHGKRDPRRKRFLIQSQNFRLVV
ncbi:hypothetical protein KEM55_000209 [Ascosphaera atra]|nr:hypothetical protein KEM55_000209 [Ascosphaera atra]